MRCPVVQSSLLAQYMFHRENFAFRKDQVTLAAARAGGVGVCIFGSQAHARTLASACMSGTGLIEGKLLGDGGKEFGDVFGSLGRGFEEEKASLLCVGLGFPGRDGALVGLLCD